MLTERQQRILNLVVGAYLESGKPVGSAAIAEDPDVEWGPSTVRAELAALEREGYLDPPAHLRRPGADRLRLPLLRRRAASPPGRSPGPRAASLDLSQMRREVEEALRETAVDALADDRPARGRHRAAAVGGAHPPRRGAAAAAAASVMVVVIASNGAVTKRVFNFAAAVDPGLVEWASSFLNERLVGLALGARMTGDRLDDPELGPAERGFLAEIGDAFTGLEREAESDLYVEGAARLLSAEHAPDLPRADSLMRALERRANLLEVLRSTLDERSVFMWIGDENPAPELRSVSVVGANYGLGYRNLGTVGVVGPLRMDYATAIASVREAAGELSRFFESVYELSSPCRATTTRCSASSASAGEAEIKKAFRALARELHPDVNTPRPRGRGEVQGGGRGLRGALRPRAAADLRRVRPRGPAQRRLVAARARAASRTSSRRSSARGESPFGDLFGGGRRGGPAAGGDIGVEVEITLAEVVTGVQREVAFEAVSACEHCRGNGAEPGTPIRTCETCGGAGQVQQVRRTRVRPARADRRLPDLRRRRQDPRAARASAATAPAARSASAPGTSRSRPGSSPASGSGSPAPATRASPGAPAGDLYVLVTVAEDERFERRGEDLISVVEVPATLAMVGGKVDGRRRSTASAR